MSRSEVPVDYGRGLPYSSERTRVAQGDTRTFLEHLFGSKPSRSSVQIWIRSPKPVTWFCDDLDAAAAKAVNAAAQFDVYMGCGIGAQAHEKPQRHRLKADEVAGIPGVWADLDINGGPDAKEGAAPTCDAALELASALLEPTLLISSGYGVQAWWLFEDPWIFSSTAEREQAKRVVGGYQGALRAAARRLGWGLDATQDLARVMRLPGTFNHKGAAPVPVKFIELEGKRYQLEEIAELGQGFTLANAAPSTNGAGPHIEIRHGVSPDPRFVELMTQEQDFLNLWQRKPVATKGLRDKSLSGIEWELARWLVRAGLIDQGVADILVMWRNTQEPGDPRGKLRAERLAQTIGKVRVGLQHELDMEFIQTERASAIEHMEQVNTGAAPVNEGKLMANFNRIIGGPAIARLKQFTRDPIHARFSIELEDGREVPLGKFDMLASQTQFSRAYAAVTGHYPAPVKSDKWHGAVAALLKAATVIDNIEDSGIGQMEMLIDDYIDYAGSSDRDSSCMIGAPFVENGITYLSLAHLVSWLRRSQGERADRADIAANLRVLGYGRRTIGYAKPDGSRSTRSYFCNGTPGEGDQVGRPITRGAQ